MLPTIELGPIQLSTYWLLYGLAALVALSLMARRLIRAGLSEHIALQGLVLVALVALAGSALFRRLALAAQTLATTGQLSWSGGSAFLGALLGASLVTGLYFPRHGLPLRRALDLCIVPVPLGQAIGRLGCLAAGCCYGRPTDSWLGVCLPDSSGVWTARYPTQLIAGAADLLIFVVLVGYERHQRARCRDAGTGATVRAPHLPLEAGMECGSPGLLFLLYMALYCLKRFSTEFLRDSTLSPLIGELNLVHIVTALGFVASLALIIWDKRRTRLRDGRSKPGEHGV